MWVLSPTCQFAPAMGSMIGLGDFPDGSMLSVEHQAAHCSAITVPGFRSSRPDDVLRSTSNIPSAPAPVSSACPLRVGWLTKQRSAALVKVTLLIYCHQILQIHAGSLYISLTNAHYNISVIPITIVDLNDFTNLYGISIITSIDSLQARRWHFTCHHSVTYFKSVGD